MLGDRRCLSQPWSPYFVHINVTSLHCFCTVLKTRLPGVCFRPCNPSKWEAGISGWLKVRRSAMLHYAVNQCPHWAYQQYGNSGAPGDGYWLGINRCQLCLQDTSCSAKWHRQARVGHWVLLCVKCCRMVDSVPIWQLSLSWPIQLDHLLLADGMIPSLGQKHSHGKNQYIPESRSWWGHECAKFRYRTRAIITCSWLQTAPEY